MNRPIRPRPSLPHLFACSTSHLPISQPNSPNAPPNATRSDPPSPNKPATRTQRPAFAPPASQNESGYQFEYGYAYHNPHPYPNGTASASVLDVNYAAGQRTPLTPLTPRSRQSTAPWASTVEIPTYNWDPEPENELGALDEGAPAFTNPWSGQPEPAFSEKSRPYRADPIRYTFAAAVESIRFGVFRAKRRFQGRRGSA